MTIRVQRQQRAENTPGDIDVDLLGIKFNGIAPISKAGWAPKSWEQLTGISHLAMLLLHGQRDEGSGFDEDWWICSMAERWLNVQAPKWRELPECDALWCRTLDEVRKVRGEIRERAWKAAQRQETVH